MKQTDDLTRFLSSVKLCDQLLGEIPITKHTQYLDLFRNPAFKNFTKRSPMIIAVYNFPEQRYEFVSESILDHYGVRPEEFTVEYGAQAFIELLKPESLELMITEITPKMLETCLQHKDQTDCLRFSACVEVRSRTGKEGWVLLHTDILSSDANGFPILSSAIGIDVSSVKKDPYIHYSASFTSLEETKILYSKNLTGTKTPVNFSKREIQIIQYLCQGETTKNIAEKLCISFETIKKQRSNILEKSGTKNTAELINFSTMTGII
jgi:DNA-binding CsgD family transcriptional regulator